MSEEVIIKEEPMDDFEPESICGEESIQLEDRLFYYEQTLFESDHAYAQNDDCESIGFKSSNHFGNKPLPSIYECKKKCGKIFATITERVFHESHEHKDNHRTIKCNFCNKKFDSFLNLTRHMPEHRNVQRYVCIHCSDCYESYQDLQKHWEKSAGCYKGDIVAEKSRNVSILKKALTQQKNKDVDNKYESAMPNQIGEQCEEAKKGKPKAFDHNITKNLSWLPQITPSAQQQSKSFAEEIKAFAAKYQLKNSLVAKKRTSAVVYNPINVKISKTSSASRKERTNFGIMSHKYAVPKAIGFVNNEFTDSGLITKIKEEIMDQDDEHLETESNVPVTGDIKIKSEPLNDDVKIKNEPIDDLFEDSTPADVNPTVGINSEQIIVTSSEVPYKICNTAMKSTEHKPIQILESNKCLTSDENFMSKNYKNIKILKLAPNARIIRLPALEVQTIQNFNQNVHTNFLTATPNEKSSTSPPFCIKQENETSVETKLEDAQSKHQNKMEKRINYIPKEILRAIEQQPQTMEIIEDFKRQIQLVNEISKSSSLPATEKIEEKIDESKPKSVGEDICYASEGAPSSFNYSMSDTFLIELNKARVKYQKYRFFWMCPRCTKKYDKRHALQGHLVNEHDMSHEDFKNVMVEVKPFPLDKPNFSKQKQRAPSKKKDPPKLSNGKIEESSAFRFLTNSQLRCPKCNRFCSSRTMLQDHIDGDCSRVPQFHCPKCSKAFYSSQTLNCHLTIHTGELPHKCNFCDKRFRTRGQVTVHHRTHTGEKPFLCQICSQRFTHRETLISHLSRHIGMKRYRCYGCGEHFSCVSGLKSHHETRSNTCGKVKLNTRAVGPRVRVIRGEVCFEPQPEINAYLRTEDPPEILSEIQNIQKGNSES